MGVVVGQLLNCVQLFATPWNATHQASRSFIVSWSLFKLMSTELVMLSNHLILCLPLLFRPSIFPSIRGLSSELAVCIRWDQNIGASASASVFPMNIQSWFLLGLTGRISLQSKGLSDFFKVWLSHSYMITGKSIALTITDLCCCSQQSGVSAF